MNSKPTQFTGDALLFTKIEFDRACDLMHANRLTDFDQDEQLAIALSIENQEYYLVFRLPGDLSMLNSSTPPLPGGLEFIFKCNSIAFHPAASPANYMICFLEVEGRLKTPRLLIAGNESGIRRLITYSIPGVESEGEIEFPKQL